MSDVTSNSYPVITVSKSGDQFLVVQNGQLKKLTRAGMADFIDGLSPETILELTDTPASYVGQQGKVLVVAPGEESMVFEAATSGNWLSLSDTPGSYGGQGLKLVRVNAGETGLEFIDEAFIELADTPASFAGASGDLLAVNTGATAVEFVTPQSKQLTGWASYADGTYTAGSPFAVTAGTTVDLPNDAATVLDSQLPTGVTQLYDGLVITPENDGDAYDIGIRFTTESSVLEGAVRVFIDIGGSIGTIVSDFRRLARGTGIANRCTFNFVVYSGSTFVANGGTVRFEAITGDQEVYDINYVINRIHRAI